MLIYHSIADWTDILLLKLAIRTLFLMLFFLSAQHSIISTDTFA